MRGAPYIVILFDRLRLTVSDFFFLKKIIDLYLNFISMRSYREAKNVKS